MESDCRKNSCFDNIQRYVKTWSQNCRYLYTNVALMLLPDCGYNE
jgi:hypothetical protein